jgi:transposase
MIAEQAFERLLGLDDGWEVAGAEYETEGAGRFVLVVRETPRLWPKLRCPQATCGTEGITCYDHTPTRSWRHLDAFGKKTEILCEPPRGCCPRCGQVFRVPVPWEGQGKHFTRDFEAFALTLMREMPMAKASAILDEHDTRLWRLLFAHVDRAYAALELSNLVHLGVDELSCRKGHDYLSVFADLVERRVVFATEGKDHTVFERFAEEILKHNGHPKAVTQVAMDMSAAYTKGAQENLGNAAIVYDKFHVVALANGAVDEVRRDEAREGGAAVKAQLKRSLWLWRKNPENLTASEQARLEQLDLKHLATGQAYQMRLELQSIYQSRTIAKARERWQDWIGWVRRKGARLGDLLAPMQRLADTLEKHLEGVLAHWQEGLTTSFMEGLNSVFSAVKRKARGYRTSFYMITMLYFVAGKLAMPSILSHSK